MPQWTPDPTFYPSLKMAMEAPPETLAYLAILDPTRKRPDALAVVDVLGHLVGQLDMPNAGDELHNFGWNACSSCLCPYAPHPHMKRRYLVVPGLRSSRIHIIDTKPDPRQPKIVKVIEPETVIARTGYTRIHTSHCGPDGIYMNALGSPNGEGPGGVFMMDAETFDLRGRWEVDRGPQYLAYDLCSRDGRRVYFTNSLYASWDGQFYPDEIKGWMVKADADPNGGLQLDPNFFLEFDSLRPHQVHLEGGDASSDSFCFP